MPENHDIDPLRDYASNGNQEAFAALVRQYASLVHATAGRLTRNDALIHDITQATFIVLAKKAGQIDPRYLAGWLVNTTRLAAREAIRGEQLRQKHEGRAVLMNLRPERATDGSEAQQILPQLDEALGALRMGDRTAVVLRFFQGASFAEVGIAMGITEEAARKRVTRAVEQLRKLLKKRGVVASVASLMLVMGAQQAQAAPAHIVASALAAHQVTAVGASAALAGRVLLAMHVAKGSLALAACVALVVAGGAAMLMAKGPDNAPAAAPSTLAAATSPQTAPTSQPAANADPDPVAPGSVRVVYVPGAKTGGFNFARLAKPAGLGIYMTQGNVQPGGQFPVQDPQGTTLFTIRLIAGDDNHASVELSDGKGMMRLELQRGPTSVEVAIAGEAFAIVYPTVTRAATLETLKEPPTTDHLPLIVLRLQEPRTGVNLEGVP